MTWAELAAAALMGAGALFFLGGALGLLRFPDTLTRLHALTKADNVGLGLVALGAALVADDAWDLPKIALVWVLAMVASATSGYLVARHALRGGPGGEGRGP